MFKLKEAKSKKTEERCQLTSDVARIIDRVRHEGDKALIDFSTKFDRSNRVIFKVTKEEIDSAKKTVKPELISHMERAAENIRNFSKRQLSTITDLPEEEIESGVFLGQRVIPINSCACYVPGGGYPLFSTALMLAIPATVAGVNRVIACSPVMNGTDKIHPAILTALSIAEVDEIYAVGGAQAIAACTWGTEQIAPVDIIVGPGNKYVTEAKRQCYGQVGIDFVAGPSEVLIIADETANASFIAADLLAQSEHDINARGILLCTSEQKAKETIKELEKQLKELKTGDIAEKAWIDNGQIIVVDSIEEACALSNDIAPEHLELNLANPEEIKDKLTNYGALFSGQYSAEVFGDYISGSNHTLPTLRAARYTGGVWVGTFLKICTSQTMTKEAAARLAPIASNMAKAEGLDAHRKAAEIRG